MNTKAIKDATRQWAKDNGDTIDTACQHMSQFIHTGTLPLYPANILPLFAQTVMQNKDDQDRTARLVLQTLEEITAARGLMERAWNTDGNEAGLLFDAAARIDPTIDAAALKRLHAQQRTATEFKKRNARGLC